MNIRAAIVAALALLAGDAFALTATSPSATFTTPSSGTAFPGQPGDVVGYTGAPCSGSLTAFNGPWVANTTYVNKLIDGGTSAVNVTAGGITIRCSYIGASTNSGTGSQSPIVFSGTGATPILDYDTIGPSPSVVGGSFPPQPPGGGGYTTWPSRNVTSGYNGIAAAFGNQYGPLSNGGSGPPAGGITITNCDIFGLGNGNVFSNVGQTNPYVMKNTWLHDMYNPTDGSHQDGVGDVQSMTGDHVQYLVLDHNTIASNGNTQALAMQAPSDFVYDHNTITNNFWAGYGWTLTMEMDGSLTRTPNHIVFTGNVFGPLPIPQFGLQPENDTANFSISGSGNQWRNNTFLGGNYTCAQVNCPGNIAAGQFMWPDGSAHAADFTGAF